MIEVADQLGGSVRLPAPPRRIVSLVPSQTELLIDLGAGDRVVGITRYCTEPAEQVAGIQRIGGTKRFHFDRIDALQPDLVIGNKEENYAEGIARLQARYPVWMSDIASLPEALAMIAAVGQLVGRAERAEQLVREIEAGFRELRPEPVCSAAYLIWREPWMVAAANTFIDDLMQRAGLRNVFGEQQRYPEVHLATLQERRPEVVLLSSEPFPFDSRHVTEIGERLPGSRVLLVDGTLFSWYGSRLRRSAAYLETVRSRCR